MQWKQNIELHLVGEGEADCLPPLDGDGDDQEDRGREGEVTSALQDGKQEAQRVNLGAIIIGLLGQFWVNHMNVLCQICMKARQYYQF